MITRRRFLESASAAGVLWAISGRAARADAPAMTRETRDAMTPDQALDALVQGNARFVGGGMRPRDLMAQVRATATGQYPFAAVLDCMDSRVPPEIVFDQGIGDVFIVRVAGNFVDVDLLGSLEFATKVSGAKLVVVLGHTDCGAIKGACDDVQLGNLTATLSHIAPAVYAVPDTDGGRSSKNKAFVQKVAEANVRLNVKAIGERSAVMRELVDAKQLRVVGAMYDLATGKVTFSG